MHLLHPAVPVVYILSVRRTLAARVMFNSSSEAWSTPILFRCAVHYNKPFSVLCNATVTTTITTISTTTTITTATTTKSLERKRFFTYEGDTDEEEEDEEEEKERRKKRRMKRKGEEEEEDGRDTEIDRERKNDSDSDEEKEEEEEVEVVVVVVVVVVVEMVVEEVEEEWRNQQRGKRVLFRVFVRVREWSVSGMHERSHYSARRKRRRRRRRRRRSALHSESPGQATSRGRGAGAKLSMSGWRAGRSRKVQEPRSHDSTEEEGDDQEEKEGKEEEKEEEEEDEEEEEEEEEEMHTALVVVTALLVGVVWAEKAPHGPPAHHFSGQDSYSGSQIVSSYGGGGGGHGHGGGVAIGHGGGGYGGGGGIGHGHGGGGYGGGGGGGYPHPDSLTYHTTSYQTHHVPVAVPYGDGGQRGKGKGKGKGGPFRQLNKMFEDAGKKLSKFVSDYIDYNVDDHHETTYSYAAPIHHAPAGHSYAPAHGHGHQGYGQPEYYAVAVPAYEEEYDDYEESFGSKLAKGWKDAKDQVRKWEEEAAKTIKDFCE
ncbi:hypothetical protein E2C01_000696 [Portunus trituberculatus]|uniref:Uncharacterized protein n=1 Tax=Portunus trituberculatus TaxID=210409 RepID=A0A5B7CFS5_PORTR|nr:hypothetical protein [Portunus trituberculatus]